MDLVTLPAGATFGRVAGVEVIRGTNPCYAGREVPAHPVAHAAPRLVVECGDVGDQVAGGTGAVHGDQKGRRGGRAGFG